MEREVRPVRIRQKLNDLIDISDIQRNDQMPLETPNWEILNSSLYGPNGISEDFLDTLNLSNYVSKGNAGFAMSSYLKNNFKEKSDGIIFVEMGGPGERLARDIDEVCKIKKSFGMSLPIGIKLATDKNKLNINNLPEYHEIISGDMFLYDKFNELKNKLNGEKVDLLIERMKGGNDLLDGAVCHPNWYYKHLDNWYKLLNDNGVMFIEVPPLLRTNFPYLNEWFDKMKKTNGIGFGTNHNNGFFRIHKLPNAPEKLPSPYSLIKKQL